MKSSALCFKLVCILALFVLPHCGKKKDYTKIIHDPMLYCKTVKKLNDIVLENIFSPPVASRNYAYAAIAAYEAMLPGDQRFTSLSGTIKHLPPLPKPESAKHYDFPFAALIAFCRVGSEVTFPKGSMNKYVDYLTHLADSAGMPSSVLKNSAAFGNIIADAVIEWSKSDHYLETRGMPKFSISIEDESRWLPTPPAYGDAIEPHWGEIRPMILDSASEFKPPTPPKFSLKDPVYYKEIAALKKAVDSLTEEQKHIADFWDDNPFTLNVVGHMMFGTKKFSPPGHWMNICGIAAEKSNADFGTTVYAYVVTGIALFDAFISSWGEKYRSATVRPETIINKYIEEKWRPHIQTPPFPDYTCGHSTISASAAEALTSVYGDSMAFTDTSEIEFGIKSRSFNSFRQAAEENIWARFYGGIHIHFSCTMGNVNGKQVGELIVQKIRPLRKQ